jgi:predicted esterase
MAFLRNETQHQPCRADRPAFVWDVRAPPRGMAPRSRRRRAGRAWVGYSPAMRAFFSLSLVAAMAGCTTPTPAADGGGDSGPPDDAGIDAFVPPDVFLPDDPGPAHAIFVLATPTAGTFFDLPWPTDVRTDAMHHPDMTGFIPTGAHSAILTTYLNAIQSGQVGFATNGAMYFRFSRHLDTTTLPTDAHASTDAASSVYLIDIDPTSPTVGARIPILTRYQQLATVFWPERTLAMRTLDGMPLAGNRLYAAVVTDRVHATDGTAFGRDTDFASVVAGTAPAPVMAVYQPALTALASDLPHVISLAVFRTQDPTGLAMQIRDYIHSQPVPGPTMDGIVHGGSDPHYSILEGHYGPVPIFQSGTNPYVTDGGQIDLDDGHIVEGTFDAHFALTIPFSTMPAAGYPLVLYSHGTGGDYRSFIDDGTATRLAAVGIAVMGIDQPYSGERNPTTLNVDILTFNFDNPQSFRFTAIEGAVDIVSQARYAHVIDIPTTLLDRNGAQIHFDAANTFFFGHSQGAQTAPLYLAIDDACRAGLISEGGSLITYPLLLKTDPISIPQILMSALGLHETLADEGFDLFHPVATALQGWIEDSDPSNYAPYLFQHPRAGFAPKSIFMTEGGMDPDTPPPAIEALAVAIGVPQVDPIWRRIANEDFLGIAPATSPVTANVAGGAATAGLLQFPMEGHFSVFDNTECQTRYHGFFMSLVSGGPGTIPAP